MEVTDELIERVARNARLALSRTEKAEFAKEFRGILDLYERLDEIDVSGVAPALQPVDLDVNLREDTVKDSFSQTLALSNSLHKKDGFIKGPRTM
jgi:aspartyl-tRNA(Asn)/glutamyl-tRNA(Gln) amidotransferase subunit C